MNESLLNHLKSIEAIPRHTERARRIRRAVKNYNETLDPRELLRLEFYEREVALEILDME